MWRELYWNQASEDHVAKHDVTPAEVEEVVNTRPRYESNGREGTVLIYGQTDSGRLLLIVLAESTGEPGAWYVITARDLTDNEARTFREKGR